MFLKKGLAAAPKVAMFVVLLLATFATSASVMATDIYVATTGDDATGDGSAGNPYRTIQKGINSAASGSTVHVAAGIYEESFTWMVQDRRLVGDTGATLQGTLTLERVISTARIEGMTFQGAVGTQGGAVNMTASNLTFSNCTFTGNTADKEGGAVWASMSNFRMERCVFTGNSATGNGGAIYLVDSSPAIVGCTFTGNTAGSGMIYALGGNLNLSGNTISHNGDGVFLGKDCLAEMMGNTISHNSGTGLSLDRTGRVQSVGDIIFENGGDGIYCYGGDYPLVANAIIAGNGGNGINAYASYVIVVNSTMADNIGAGLTSNALFPEINNCILWGNGAVGDLVKAKATYSDIGTGETDGEGNISKDPKFVGEGDYHLQWSSPCINQGNNNAASLPETDIDGDPRILDGTVDMGADETAPAPDIQPDLWIKHGPNWLGDNVYNDDGTDQTGTRMVVRAATAVYRARLYNDGDQTETFWVKGPAGDENWTVRYYRGTTVDSAQEVTADVISALGWELLNVPPRGVQNFVIAVKPGLSATESYAGVVQATADLDATQVDALQIITTVTNVQPDLWIKQGGIWLGNDIFNADGAGQTGSRTVGTGSTAVYYARLYNDGAQTETFWVKGPAGDENWTVRYFQGTTEVTDHVTSSTGWKRTNVAPGAMRGFSIKVSPNSGASGSFTALVRAESNRDPAQWDTLKMVTRVK